MFVYLKFTKRQKDLDCENIHKYCFRALDEGKITRGIKKSYDHNKTFS